MADVEPWTTVFNPGTSTLDRLVELTREVDFAAFVFAQDDWTAPTRATRARRSPARPRRGTTWCSRPGCSAARWACGGRSSCTRTARSCPTDLLGLTCVRYAADADPDRAQDGQPEGPEGDRGRGPAGAHRGRLVAVLAHRAHRGRAVGDQPAPDLARPERRAGGQRPLVAGGRHPVGALLERGVEGADRPGRGLLLLERRAARGTRTRPGSRAPARSSSSPRTAPAGYWTTRVGTGAGAERADVRASTCAPTPRTWPSSTAATCRSAVDADRRSGCGTGTAHRQQPESDCAVPLGQRLQVEELAPHHHQVAPGQRVRAGPGERAAGVRGQPARRSGSRARRARRRTSSRPGRTAAGRAAW